MARAPGGLSTRGTALPTGTGEHRDLDLDLVRTSRRLRHRTARDPGRAGRLPACRVLTRLPRLRPRPGRTRPPRHRPDGGGAGLARQRPPRRHHPPGRRPLLTPPAMTGARRTPGRPVRRAGALTYSRPPRIPPHQPRCTAARMRLTNPPGRQRRPATPIMIEYGHPRPGPVTRPRAPRGGHRGRWPTAPGPYRAAAPTVPPGPDSTPGPGGTTTPRRARAPRPRAHLISRPRRGVRARAVIRSGVPWTGLRR